MKKRLTKDKAVKVINRINELRSMVKNKDSEMNSQKVDNYKGFNIIKYQDQFLVVNGDNKIISKGSSIDEVKREVDKYIELLYRQHLGMADKETKDSVYRVVLNLKGEIFNFPEIEAKDPERAKEKCVSALELKTGRVRGSLQKEFDGSKNNYEVVLVRDSKMKDADNAKEEKIPRDLFAQKQIEIAKKTLRTANPMLGVMGGMTKEEARKILMKYGIKFEDSKMKDAESISEDLYTRDPLTEKGKEILKAMKEQYGEEEGERVFYASKNAGKLTGVDTKSEDKDFSESFRKGQLSLFANLRPDIYFKLPDSIKKEMDELGFRYVEKSEKTGNWDMIITPRTNFHIGDSRTVDFNLKTPVWYVVNNKDSKTVDGYTEYDVKEAISKILADRKSYETSLNYAVNYCRVAMGMTGRELIYQVPYILNNITTWRHPDAAQVREVLKGFYKQEFKRVKDSESTKDQTEDQGFDIRNLEKETVENKDFRRVLYTTKNEQLVLMSIDVGDDIGMETHDSVDQFFRIEEGEGKLVIEGKGEFPIANGSSILIKQGIAHNIVNTGSKPLKLYTIYSPPNHPPDTIQFIKINTE